MITGSDYRIYRDCQFDSCKPCNLIQRDACRKITENKLREKKIKIGFMLKIYHRYKAYIENPPAEYVVSEENKKLYRRELKRLKEKIELLGGAI